MSCQQPSLLLTNNTHETLLERVHTSPSKFLGSMDLLSLSTDSREARNVEFMPLTAGMDKEDADADADALGTAVDEEAAEAVSAAAEAMETMPP